jgi:hypothetical protein
LYSKIYLPELGRYGVWGLREREKGGKGEGENST